MQSTSTITGDRRCVVVVAAGELTKTSVASRSDRGWALQTRTFGAGRSVRFARRHVHDIANRGDAPAISVHVYAPRLTSMTYYRLHEGVLESEATFRCQFGEAVA